MISTCTLQNDMLLVLQFFAGVISFAFVTHFVPEPTLAPGSDIKRNKVAKHY